MKPRSAAAVEWWGGAECTINRVGDCYFEQLLRTGHAQRVEDLELIAGLGIRKLRFPILWEQHHSVNGTYDFSWADARMHRLRELGIEPIVGLVHHGSGPMHTSLLQDTFAHGLADFAGRVARRYPWVESFTPVNEPLTTARFSGLYGHWYPHAQDSQSFVRCLLTQVRATQLSMQAIRAVTPRAQLVQTEDIGTAFATPGLTYQASFENHRRWLSLDLLFGEVTERHALYRYLIDVAHVDPRQLREIAHSPCPPDVIGINYYVTSDRFLDERLHLFPASVCGTNGRDVYADVEAVRVRAQGIVGHIGVINAVWRRYRTPLALTEVHLGCCEDEQVLWLTEAWQAAQHASASGVDIRGVTAWSLFGAFDWDSLVTRQNDNYEPGAFDVRYFWPKATRVAETIRHLATQPCLASDAGLGWWRRPERLTYPAFDSAAAEALATSSAA